MTKHRNAHHDYDLATDLERIKSAVLDATHDVRGKAGEFFSEKLDDVKERTEVMQDNVTGYIKKQPLKSMGITLLAGLIAGYLIHK